MNTLVALFALVAVAVASPTFNYAFPQPKAYIQVQQPAVATYSGPALSSTQFHAQDTFGTYKFGYSSSDGQEKVEARDYEGRVAGRYSYIDTDGDEVELKYVADKDGFRAEGEHLPKAPVQPEQPDFLKKAYKEAEDRLKEATIQAAVSTQYTGEQRLITPTVGTYGGFKSVTSTSGFVPAPVRGQKVGTSTSYTTYTGPAATTYVRPEATTYIRPEATTYIRPETITYIRSEVDNLVRPAELTTYGRTKTSFVGAPLGQTVYTSVEPSTPFLQPQVQVPARHGFVYTSSSSTGGAAAGGAAGGAATSGKSVDSQHHHHHHVLTPGGGAVTQPATIITIPTSTPTPTPAVSVPLPSFPGKSGGTYVYRY